VEPPKKLQIVQSVCVLVDVVVWLNIVAKNIRSNIGRNTRGGVKCSNVAEEALRFKIVNSVFMNASKGRVLFETKVATLMVLSVA
jgi:hypothetical protein